MKDKTKLLDIENSIEYMEKLYGVAEGYQKVVINKNLGYARAKKEELCKKIGFGDLTNSSTTSQRLEGKV